MGSNPEKEDAGPSVAAWAIGNVILSVSLVTVNKIIMKSYGFNFVLVLSACHFVATGIFLECITRFGWFGATPKRMPPRDNWITAAVGAFGIVFMNLSLQTNSISFYQITKLCIIPTVLLVDFVREGKTQTVRVYLSLSLLLLGVGVATVTDVEASLKGMGIALIAVVSTAQFQIWQGSKQKQHGLSAIQATHSVAMPQAVVTILAAVPLERDIMTHRFDNNYTDVALIALTCLIAMVMNVTSFGLIGKTSATTFQVVGHAKTCLIIASGFIFYPPPYFSMTEVKNLLGICIAIVGMILYGHIKNVDGKRASGEDVSDCLESCLPGPAVKSVGDEEGVALAPKS
eukprot:Tamp_22473.p1 GENE.Tamp_22473~~Tamp_22473.p1  ORF type:complete len:344 (+),score=55.33 Tamp_22473:46-1077(+)